jgi:hypothetical protein
VTLTTDSEASEMGLAIFDATIPSDPTFILVYEIETLVSNTVYEEELSCLDFASRCYGVLLLDQGSAGFVSTGGLEVTVNGETILSVGPGDLEYNPEFGALAFFNVFGNCDAV